MGTPVASCTPRMKLPPPVETATGLSWSAIRVVVHRHYKVIFSGPSRFVRLVQFLSAIHRKGWLIGPCVRVFPRLTEIDGAEAQTV